MTKIRIVRPGQVGLLETHQDKVYEASPYARGYYLHVPGYRVGQIGVVHEWIQKGHAEIVNETPEAEDFWYPTP